MADVADKPKPAGKAHPSGDKRFKLLEVTMKRHQFRSDALIEVLHAAQELFGFLELDLLFFIARHLKLDPEEALRKANGKFIRRFAYIEERLAETGKTPEQSTLEEMDSLWDEIRAKDKERGPAST